MTNALEIFLSQASPADYREFLSADGLDLGAEEFLVRNPRVTVTDDRDALSGVGRIQPLDWDSTFFDTPSGRLEGLFFTDKVGLRGWSRSELIERLVDRAETMNLRHLTCRIRADDLSLAHCLERADFHLVDIMTIYQRSLENLPLIEGGQDQKIPTHRKVMEFLGAAVKGMQWGRVFHDPQIDRETAEKFYIEMSNFYLTKGAHITAIYEGDRLAGVALGITDEELSRSLGKRYGYLWLIIVSPEFMGRGFGSKLFDNFCRTFSRQCDLLEIGTQIANIPANRLYMKAGCIYRQGVSTFHKWGRDELNG